MSDRNVFSHSLGSAPGSVRGQALVELALVLPILLVLVGGIVQLGTVIATQHSLTQIGRDVGRWAATQGVDPCEALADVGEPAIRAHEIAVESRLMAYGGAWSQSANFQSYDLAPIPSTPPTGPKVEVSWEIVDGACPPVDSTTAAFVEVRLAHEAPVLIPGLDLVLAQLPNLGSDGKLLITTSAKFRMEPQAIPPASPAP